MSGPAWSQKLSLCDRNHVRTTVELAFQNGMLKYHPMEGRTLLRPVVRRLSGPLVTGTVVSQA